MHTYSLVTLVLASCMNNVHAFPAATSPSEALEIAPRVGDAILPAAAANSPTRGETELLPIIQDLKRQIHNADYHANGPPPSPNEIPPQDSVKTTPTTDNSPTAAAPAPTSGDAKNIKRTLPWLQDVPGLTNASPLSPSLNGKL